jgi:hemoglobin-like flavoprotein
MPPASRLPESTMDQKQVDLVRASFASLPKDAEAVGMLFYALLFKIDPDLRPIFKGDIRRQSAMLATMLATAVENLDRLDLVLSAVRDLGRRHAGYGVKEGDYDTVETALLLTLAQALGSDFTAEVRRAWIACYRILAEVMKSAAREAVGRARAA